MTPTQWRNVAERVRLKKLDPFWLTKSVGKWCEANGIRPAKQEFLKALERGDWRFDCLVIQCLGFDRDLYASLKHVVPQELTREETTGEFDEVVS